MIKNKYEFTQFLEIELGRDYSEIKNWFYYLMTTSTKSYIRILRKTEYYTNQGGLYHKIISKYYKFRLQRQSVSTGISIPINVCDKGLTIYHYGSIVVNGACKIGKNCCISNNVNIGATGGSTKAPIIGDDVYIGPGAVIFGDISIADGCYIGANAVVCKSIQEPHSVVVGVPAKIIKKDYVVWWKKNNLNR